MPHPTAGNLRPLLEQAEPAGKGIPALPHAHPAPGTLIIGRSGLSTTHSTVQLPQPLARAAPTSRRSPAGSRWSRTSPGRAAEGSLLATSGHQRIQQPAAACADSTSRICAVTARRTAPDNWPRRVDSRASGLRTMRSEAGSMSTLSMMRAAMQAGSPGGDPLADRANVGRCAPGCRRTRASGRRLGHCRARH
jgi:hypothetical protein